MPDFHIKRRLGWRPITLNIVKNPLYSGVSSTRFSVSNGDNSLGQINRIVNVRTFEVFLDPAGTSHEHLFGKPRTVWQAVLPGMPPLDAPTRSKAIADLLGLNSRGDLHQSHQPPKGSDCPLHDQE